MSARVTIVDYGIGNLLSVARAFEACDANVEIERDPDRIAAADRLVVPGVGAFGDCVRALDDLDLSAPIREHAKGGKPWLGICVGMQMMLDVGEEFGNHTGLGLIPGRCVAIPGSGADGAPHKIPHIGWNRLDRPAGHNGWAGTILETTEPGTAVYFVHSYTAGPADDAYRLADADYNGLQISAALHKDNMYGTQFHPEKSGPAGLRVIERFLSL